MTSINNLGSNGYYQLSGQSAGNTAGKTQTSPTGTLLQALSGNVQQQDSNSAYLLNLSPQAQSYLTGINSASSSGSLSNGNDAFLLTTQDRQTISGILAKYKDAPYTQETFNKIQDDLHAAGLDTNTLSLKDKAQTFNPAQVLINALNGGTTSDANSGFTSDASEQTKSGNFIQQVIAQWKNIAGDNVASVSDDEGGVAPVSGTGVA